ncbi:hypothetical protein ABG768_011146, partial [Culter alburnus]
MSSVLCENVWRPDRHASFLPPCVSSELCSLTAVALMTGVAARYRDIQEALKALCGHR